jgi:cellulose synthase/poly-beta-1,6-N-acetylglucosamine synthase-like glycosyltransferase
MLSGLIVVGVGCVLGGLALGLLLPVGVLLVETCAALWPPRSSAAASAGVAPTIAVLVPAHDEEAQIGATVQALLPALAAAPGGGAGPGGVGAGPGPKLRLIVIADNCTDGTAAEARAAGARAPAGVQVEIIERADRARRGKGFALAFGLRHLDAAPPEVVVIIDADCRLAEGDVATLARLARSSGRPVQAEYVLEAPPHPSPLAAISALAVLLRNRVRPRGLHRLGLPCHLTGSGMAFPWRVLREAPETEANLVEDLVMGLDMALAGAPPLLCPAVQVTSELPAGRAAASTQRRRWEHGQLHTLRTYVPRLLLAGLIRRRPALVGLGLDLLVPPLALLVMLQAAVAAGAWLALWLHLLPAGAFGWAIAGMAAAGLLGTTLAVGVAWARFGRATVPLRFLLFIPFYVAWKIPLYLLLAVRGRQKTWVRTARRDPPPRAK